MKKVYFLPFLATAFCSLISGCCQEPDSIASLPSQYVTLDDSIQIHYKQWDTNGNVRSRFRMRHEVNCDYVHLVGHSLGTPVCRQTAYEHPSNIAGIMDIDGVYCFYPKLSDNPTEEELAAATAQQMI